MNQAEFSIGIIEAVGRVGTVPRADATAWAGGIVDAINNNLPHPVDMTVDHSGIYYNSRTGRRILVVRISSRPYDQASFSVDQYEIGMLYHHSVYMMERAPAINIRPAVSVREVVQVPAAPAPRTVVIRTTSRSTIGDRRVVVDSMGNIRTGRVIGHRR